MSTNNNDEVSEPRESTGPATAAAVLKKELFLGIDTADVKQVVGPCWDGLGKR